MKKLSNLLILLCFFVSGLFFFLAYKEYRPVAEVEQRIEELKKIAVIEKTGESDTDKEDALTSPIDRVIDFHAVEDINEDIIGWLYIPGTSIDYPILIGDTDTAYLNRDAYGKPNSAGSIFTYANTDKQLRDARIFLFGHNTSTYHMFGELKRYYKEDDFFNDHRFFYIYTKETTMEVEIVSIFSCQEDDAVLSENASLESEEYKSLLSEIRDRNAYSDVSWTEDLDTASKCQSISLITCKGRSGTSVRLVITGLVRNTNTPSFKGEESL